MFDDIKENDVMSFEEIYQRFVLECRQNGLSDPTRAELKKVLDDAESKGAVKKID